MESADNIFSWSLMDRKSYKTFHELFVSNHQGTTLTEINLISLVCPLSVLVILKLESFLLPRLWTEFFILVAPLLIVFTDVINPFDAVFTFAVFASFINLLPSSAGSTNGNERRLAFLTNYRASMLLVTSICILGVDFPAFPRSFLLSS